MTSPLFRHCLAAFCLDCAMMLGHTAMPFFIFQQLGGDEGTSGAVAAAMALGYMVVCLGSSEIVRRLDNSLKAAAWGALAFGVFFSLGCFARNGLLFGALLTAAFASMAFSWPAMHAWLGGESNLALRGRMMATFNISWSAGMALGAIVAGPMFVLDYRLPFLMVALLGACSFGLLYRQPSEVEFFGPPAAPPPERRNNDLRSEAYLYATWLAIFVGFVIQGASRSVYPKRLETLVADGELSILGHQEAFWIFPYSAPTLFSILAFGIMITSAIVYFVMGRTTSWHHRFRLIVGLQVLTAVACYVMAHSHSLAALYLCYTIIGANTYAVFFTGVFYCIVDPIRKHRRTAINESFVGAGNFAGSLGFGWIAGMTSITWVFAYAPWLFVVAIVLEMLLLRRGLARTDQPTTAPADVG